VSGTAHISDLALGLVTGQRWAMVRTHFGITAFGVNAYIADEAGIEVIGEHDELGERSGKHEELYFVANGHATFTVNGDEIDAPSGTFVFVRDPAAKRKAVALEVGATIIIVGGRPGEAFTPSPWERNAPALAYFATGEYDKAVEELEQVHAEAPEDPGVLYNLACAESMSGKGDRAIRHLAQAIELDASFAELAEKDSDFDAIRDDPKFASTISGKPNAGGASS
jgi:tetratricopeptide (TPR) repeat protein